MAAIECDIDVVVPRGEVSLASLPRELTVAGGNAQSMVGVSVSVALLAGANSIKQDVATESLTFRLRLPRRTVEVLPVRFVSDSEEAA